MAVRADRRADEHALHAWLERHCPQTARRFPIVEMRRLRERVFAEHPQHAHDLSLLRRLTLERALRDSGGDVALAEAAYAIFFGERNRVEFYPDALAALERLAARVPIAALTNGNADLAAIGIAGHFRFQLGAREHGAAKPDAGIFHAACARLGRRAARSAARRRRCRDGRGRRASRRPAQLLDQPPG